MLQQRELTLFNTLRDEVLASSAAEPGARPDLAQVLPVAEYREVAQVLASLDAKDVGPAVQRLDPRSAAAEELHALRFAQLPTKDALVYARLRPYLPLAMLAFPNRSASPFGYLCGEERWAQAGGLVRRALLGGTVRPLQPRWRRCVVEASGAFHPPPRGPAEETEPEPKDKDGSSRASPRGSRGSGRARGRASVVRAASPPMSPDKRAKGDEAVTPCERRGKQLPVWSHLSLATHAGLAALPKVLRFCALVGPQSSWRPELLLDRGGCASLPIEIEPMGVHSVFTCPVTRMPTSATNLPMLLPCGHCISQLALERLVGRRPSAPAVGTRKCPVCPCVFDAAAVRPLYFS